MKLITHSTNITYLTGFTGSAGFLLMGRKNIFFTDFRYAEIAKKLAANGKSRIPFEFVEMDSNLKAVLAKKLKTPRTIEFEANHVTVAELKRWKKLFKGHKLVPTKKPIEEQRWVKSEAEVKLLKKSQDINAAVLERVKKVIKTGDTELEIAWQIKAIGHELGAEDISFEPIVAFGPNSASPHHQNSSRKLKKRDIILIDMGMKYKGYCSDMTRTFFHGKPTEEQSRVYNLVLQAQLAGIAATKAGVKASTPDKAARKVMGDMAVHFGHSLGHGIGLDVHEHPGVSSRSKATLKEGMIVTMEPGIYLPGKFGVRIEDMGRVTKTGYENFTKVTK
ncbi:MAG: Xaa-Pro aminopeptidase [Oceanicoccus sp.]|jgi:Xaa-Pro aminopeptidase